MGTTHHYEYFANNKPIGSYQVAAYNPDAYPLPGAACGALAREHRYVIKIYPGMDTRYWTCANPGIDTVRGAPVMVWKEGQTIASDINLLRRRL